MKDSQRHTQNKLAYGEVPSDAAGEVLEPNTLIIEEETLRRGFTTAPNCILDDTAISIAARFTYIILLSFAWQQGSCFPGQDRLAHKLGVSRQMVNRYLAELREKGFIDWQRRGLGRTNVYRILKLPPSEADVNYSLHPDVKPRSHLNVKPVLHKEYSVEENTERKDSDPSNLRTGRALKKNDAMRPKERWLSKEDTQTSDPHKPSQNEPLSGKIAHVLATLSTRDLHDPTHIKSNITHALNLWRQSKLAEAEFLVLVVEARQTTLARAGSIRKKAENYMGLKNRAPYFFQVLKNLIRQHALATFRTELSIRKAA